QTGKCQPQLGTDYMDDALAAALDVIERDSELAAVCPQSLHLAARKRIADLELVVGGDIVVQRGERQVGPTHAPASQAETIKRLGAGHLMNEVAIDVKQRRLGGRGHHMAIPYFLKQRLWHARSTFSLRESGLIHALADGSPRFRLVAWRQEVLAPSHLIGMVA